MDRQEAIQTLSKVGKISVSYAEDLYDSFVPKPVVPQYVADWYEKNKDNLNESIWEYLVNWDDGNWNDFKRWLFKSSDNKAIATLVNMHQFGYEVEKEMKYRVRFKGLIEKNIYLESNTFRCYWAIKQSDVDNENIYHTRKELEDAGFGWVFNCEGIEIEEVE